MKIHILNTKALVRELAQNKLSERDTLIYFIANTLLWTFSIYYAALIGVFFNWQVFLEIVIVFLIVIVGLQKSFDANGGNKGEHFLIRASCLSLPIGIKLTIASIALGWVYYFSFPFLIDPVTFNDPDRVDQIIAFIWIPAFNALFVWRLWVHFMDISKLTPNKTLQPTAGSSG